MTFNTLKRMALQLINRYSIGGRIIPDEYNSQADAILELVTLTNEGMEYIATTNKRIRETRDYDMSLLEVVEDYLVLPLPEDYYEMMNGAVKVRLPGRPEHRVRSAKRHGDSLWIPLREIKAPPAPMRRTDPLWHMPTYSPEQPRPEDPALEHFHGPDGRLTFDYYRHAKQLEIDEYGMPVDPDAELDNTPETHGCLAAYVAAHLSMYDDAYAHASLYNEFETKLARLKDDTWAEWGIVEDDYAGMNFQFY